MTSSYARFDSLADAAAFCAVLVREGIVFEMRADGSRWLVELTGGY